MTNYNKRLDEIFAPLIDSPSLTLTTTYWDEAKQAIKQLVADEMLALIGDDEDTEKAYAIGFDNGESAHYNNELRQELRTKLAEWLGKGAK